MRQMTFEIPDEVAKDFLENVPESERSTVVSSLIARRRPRHVYTEEEWAAAADAANADRALNSEIDEWQSFSDPIPEAWDAPPSR